VRGAATKGVAAGSIDTQKDARSGKTFCGKGKNRKECGAMAKKCDEQRMGGGSRGEAKKAKQVIGNRVDRRKSIGLRSDVGRREKPVNTGYVKSGTRGH